ncbi:hypothetical protein JCM24511_03874 [Saitozyma sp. JCM 24511]|nr:hypothetical protein JCM24511_03874 [Saitozyma sp. JCM 24511]
MATPTKVHFPSFSQTICGELYAPADGSPDRRHAAIVVSHPMTAVKEQSPAVFAKLLSAAGFYALTFDAAYQGESTGEPRGLEDPHHRAEDVKAAVTYLSALPGKVDPSRIGVLGICASGGYTSFAAQSDSRIKALATVSGACVGRMTRNGGFGPDENRAAIQAAVDGAGQYRTALARGQAPAIQPMFPQDPAGLKDSFFISAATYYGGPNKHERSNQLVPPYSYDLMVGYDSFLHQHLISPRPLLMIAGSEAETLLHSKQAIEIAQEPKELLVVHGKGHFDLYDDTEVSGPKLIQYFSRWLTTT